MRHSFPNLSDRIEGLPLKEALTNIQVAIESRHVDLLHKDPVDRFMAATAMELINNTLCLARLAPVDKRQDLNRLSDPCHSCSIATARPLEVRGNSRIGKTKLSLV